MDHINALTVTQAHAFAGACYEQNTIGELAEAISNAENGEPDEATMTDWGLSVQSFIDAMCAALKEHITDNCTVTDSIEHDAPDMPDTPISYTYLVGGPQTDKLFVLQLDTDGEYSIPHGHNDWGDNQDMQEDIHQSLADAADWIAETLGLNQA